MPEIALVTYLASPELSASDSCLAAALEARGCMVTAVPWDDPSVRWDGFASAVVRSTWDYHLRATEFASWLDALEVANAPVWNTAAVIRWNMHKRYLLDLNRAGVDIVPTELVEAGAGTSLTEVVRWTGWDQVVVKPAVGASATGVRLLRGDEVSNAGDWYAEESAQRDLLVQRALPEIAAGEWSLVFFGGEFSHAALKVPAEGDIRVQARYGGTTSVRQAEPWVVAEAAEVLAAAAAINGVDLADLVYGRVDGVCIEGRFVLMELELIEPGLFLHLPGAEAAAARFAGVILSQLS